MGDYSGPGHSGTPESKELRPAKTDARSSAGVVLDSVDWVLLRELSHDARIPNNELARRARIAPSTSLARIRRLVDAGVVRGFYADIDPAKAGRPLEAMIAVSMQGRARARLARTLQGLRDLPGVLNVYLIGGAHDFFLHVAVANSQELNDFVIENISCIPDVSRTETSVIFQHKRGRGVVDGP